MQGISFQINAEVGEVKSSNVEELYLSLEGKFEKAESKIKSGDEMHSSAHRLHGELAQEEA